MTTTAHSQSDPSTTTMDETTRVEDCAQGLPSGYGQASIIEIHGDDLGKRYQVERELSLGRAETNDVVLSVENVSRHHALIYQQGGSSYVLDRGSTNGTFVNDVKINGEKELEHGALIRIGRTIFRFISGDHAEAQYHDEIYRLAITDGLTGLRNRRYFDDFLDREVARSFRSGAALSLVLFDIDLFKDLNDCHGHLFGDRVLCELARTVREKVRREQLLARFGGDEFALVLPDVKLPGAISFAERIRKLVEKRTFEDSDIRAELTLSLGVATLAEEMDGVALIEAADRSLYEAKSSGRNRVVAEQSEG